MLDSIEGIFFKIQRPKMATFVDGAPPFEAKYFKKKLLKIEQNGEQYEKIQTFFYKNNSVTILNEKKRFFAIFQVELPP